MIRAIAKALARLIGAERLETLRAYAANEEPRRPSRAVAMEATSITPEGEDELRRFMREDTAPRARHEAMSMPEVDPQTFWSRTPLRRPSRTSPLDREQEAWDAASDEALRNEENPQ